MKNIGIVPNLFKDADLEVTRHIVACLNAHGILPYMDNGLVKKVKARVNGVTKEQIYDVCDAIIVVGGDGTILGEAEAASRKQLPIVGVNLGRLGFLADVETKDIDEAVEKLLQGKYEIEQRMMLQATIMDSDGTRNVFHALNDINVTRGSFSRIVEFEIKVNNELSDIYRADGIIVASPTGSTAYNLSAGGPIVVPRAHTYVVTPVCPHTMYSKSVMLCEEDRVSIKTREEAKDMALSIDGKLKMYLTPQHEVLVERSPYVTRLIKLSDRKFFEILRQKIVERRI